MKWHQGDGIYASDDSIIALKIKGTDNPKKLRNLSLDPSEKIVSAKVDTIDKVPVNIQFIVHNIGPLY